MFQLAAYAAIVVLTRREIPIVRGEGVRSPLPALIALIRRAFCQRRGGPAEFPAARTVERFYPCPGLITSHEHVTGFRATPRNPNLCLLA